MKNSKSLMDIEDICGCSRLPSIIPRKELPHLRSTSGKFCANAEREREREFLVISDHSDRELRGDLFIEHFVIYLLRSVEIEFKFYACDFFHDLCMIYVYICDSS